MCNDRRMKLTYFDVPENQKSDPPDGAAFRKQNTWW